MGVKAVYGIIAISLTSIVLSTIALLSPMHRLDFFAGMAFHLATMETHATFIKFPVGKVRFCNEMFAGAQKGNDDPGQAEKEARDARGWCADLEGNHDIQDVAMHMCTPVVRMIWPQFCDGLDAAYAFGVALIIVTAANGLLQLVGCYFLYDYITRKANPTYRSSGVMCLGAGSFVFFGGVGMYAFFVIHALDSVGANGWSAALLTTSRNMGFGAGFVELVICCALQGCQVLFAPFIERENAEFDYLEAKAWKEEQREYGACAASVPAPQQQQQQPQAFGQAAPLPMMAATGPTMPTGMAVVQTVQMGPGPMVMQGATPGFAATYNAGPQPPRDLESRGPAF